MTNDKLLDLGGSTLVRLKETYSMQDNVRYRSHGYLELFQPQCADEGVLYPAQSMTIYDGGGQYLNELVAFLLHHGYGHQAARELVLKEQLQEAFQDGPS